MLVERIETKGLSHFSYLVASGGKAVVIDPRRDCSIYVERARCQGLSITHILETHRNEDIVSGSAILAELTGARVLHGPNADSKIHYAETVREGHEIDVGNFRLEVVETPGHTRDHLCFALYDKEAGDGAIGVFTGDALFVGDTGRTDFYEGREDGMAAELYGSLQKLIALGDQAIIYPAHGSGSVCGSEISSRAFSTVGHERRNNPWLQHKEVDDFVSAKRVEHHYKPPYFTWMEHLNSKGAPAASRITMPRALSVEELCRTGEEGGVIIDVREPLAALGGHFPGSLCLPSDLLSAFAGWYLDHATNVALVAADREMLERANRQLLRIGYDNVAGGFVGIVPASADGQALHSIGIVQTRAVQERVANRRQNWILLDVRSRDEFENGHIAGATHTYAGELRDRWPKLDPGAAYTVMCGSGMRAAAAASWLTQQGLRNVDVYLGSIGAWRAMGLPTTKE